MGTRRAALHLDLLEQPGGKRVFQRPARAASGTIVAQVRNDGDPTKVHTCPLSVKPAYMSVRSVPLERVRETELAMHHRCGPSTRTFRGLEATGRWQRAAGRKQGKRQGSGGSRQLAAGRQQARRRSAGRQFDSSAVRRAWRSRQEAEGRGQAGRGSGKSTTDNRQRTTVGADSPGATQEARLDNVGRSPYLTK
jgi:hypothetical protein